MRRPAPSSPHASPSLAARLGVTAATLALLALADVALRAAHVNDAYRAAKPTPFSEEDPDLVYHLRRNLDITLTPSSALSRERKLTIVPLPPFRVRTNGAGLRHDGDVPYAKEPGAWRMLCIGDSYTFGYGVNGEDAYAARVERGLRQRWPGRKVDVINCGQPGHSSVQGARFYERVLSRYDADAVTIAFAGNDYGVAVVGYGTARRRFAAGTSALQRVRHLFLRSEIFVLFLRAKERLDARLRRALPLQLPPPADVRGAPDDCRDNMVAIARMARARGVAKVLIVTEARLPGDVNEPYYRKAAAEAAARSGAVFVDVATAVDRAMAAAPAPAGGWGVAPNKYFVDSSHLTPEGHAIAAREILAAL